MANVPLRTTCNKLFGVFHSPPGGAGNPGYDSMYSSWDFDTYWKGQIDASRSIGANLLSYFGSMVAADTDLSLYLTRRRTIVEYLASVGMYALSYQAVPVDRWRGTINTARAQTIMAADAAVMAEYDNCIGYVTEDEPWASCVDYGGPLSRAEVATWCEDLYSAAKGAVPADFPVCAAPNPCVQALSACFDYTGANKTRCDLVAPYCDFFAFHPFYTVTLAESATLRAAFPGKQIIMPSSVLSENGDSDIATKSASIMALVGANNFVGMAWFLATDTPGYPDNHQGLFNNDYSERTTKTNAFRAGLASPMGYYNAGHRRACGGSGRPVFVR